MGKAPFFYFFVRVLFLSWELKKETLVVLY